MFTLTRARRDLGVGLLVLALVSVTVGAPAGSAVPASAASIPIADSRVGAAAPEDFSINFSYFHVAGSSLTPRASSTAWVYQGTGCVSASGGNDIFSIHLDLPQGARIDYLRLYYRDTSASNSEAWITTYDATGGFADLTTVSSTGAAGYGSALSPFVNHVVNNAARAYVLNWRPNQTGASMQLCGLRVAYRAPVNTTYLPAVIRR
jgi:hypothetical protein